ncbi:hypothetical protein R3F64_01470 [Halomonas sp. 5021]|uniref:hypothetical protein n=1 Tax=Halomonas sp. 5021 TaxID=3082156 RepID=UPI002FCC727A
MTSRWILCDYYLDTITPMPHLGLFCSRKDAKRAAKRRGFPIELIKKVTRNERKNA